jgi:hypothetical protein
MSNPLIAKWEELYGPKKEEPKKVEYELPIEFKTKLKELRDTSTIPCVPPQSVPISNTGITAANPYISKLISYDIDSGKDSFLQVAEKIKNGEARVTSTRMDRDVMSGTTITFEVQVFN